MAKIAFISDLHLEAQERPILARPEAEVAVFVGDILGARKENYDNDDSAVRRLDRWAQDWGMPVFLVPGNHEFEGRLIGRELDRLHRHAQGSGVRVLYNDSAIVGQEEPVLLLGSTLWTDFSLYGAQDSESCFNRCARRFGDFNIRREDGSFLELDEILVEFVAATTWLGTEMDQAQHPCVVATHFAPHKGSVADQWKNDVDTSWFVNDLPETLIEKAAAWIHGHTHSRFDYQVGRRNGFGRVFCNPYGFHQKIVLNELNEISRKMILERHPEIEVVGEITLAEVQGDKQLRVIDVSAKGAYLV